MSSPSPSKPLILGSRESQLALAQTHAIQRSLLEHHPSLQTTIETFKTHGDRFLNAPISQLKGVQGVFVKELEEALLQGAIDVAIHSLKDMPSQLPEGLGLLPLGSRETPQDVAVFRDPATQSWDTLPPGTVVGTSSLRRIALLRHQRQDLDIRSIRGNLQTRLRKLDEGEYDVIILAAAGLHRMGYTDRIHHHFNTATMVPAAGQGIVAAEYRLDNEPTDTLLRSLVHPEVLIAFQAERAFLATMEGGCHTPLGGHASLDPTSQQWTLRGAIAHPSGQPCILESLPFEASQAIEAGQTLAHTILNQGGREIRDEVLAAAQQQIEPATPPRKASP